MQDAVTSGAVSERQIAYALLRITLGINIALHGITRLTAGQQSFTEHLMKQFAGSPLPGALVYGFADALPWAEAIIGLLILMGAATRPTLISGALLMVVLTFGTSLLQDWNVAGLQLIYAVVYFLLLAFVEHNRWSIDRLIAHN